MNSINVRTNLVEAICRLVNEKDGLDVEWISRKYDGTQMPYFTADMTCFHFNIGKKTFKYTVGWNTNEFRNVDKFAEYIVNRALTELNSMEEKEKERNMTNEEKRNLVVGMVREYVNGKSNIVGSVTHNEINRVTEFHFTDITLGCRDRRTKSIIHWDDVRNCYNVFKYIIDDVEKWLNGPKHEIRYDGFCRHVKMDPKAYKAVYDSLKPKVECNFSNHIKNIIFNPPATIVFWMDGTKTVVKAHGDDEYDPEKGMAMAFSKKFLGNEYEYYNVFKHWLKQCKVKGE